jgi:tetratricopeptide (TPR) repeat protein
MAVSDLRRVLTYDNPPPQATAMLAELLAVAGGDRAEARRLLDKLIDAPSFADMPPEEQAEAYALRASVQKKPDKAEADYDQALKLSQDNVKILLARADFHREQKQLDKAAADVAAVVAKQSDDAATYLLQAQILREQNKLDEALASVDKAAELAPDDPAPVQARGELFRAQDKYDDAIKAFTTVPRRTTGLRSSTKRWATSKR